MVSEKLIDKLELLLEHFKLDYTQHHNRYSFACPLHGGDNETALNIFISGSKIVGNWKCFTHNCDETYGKGILGFVKGMLSIQARRKVSFGEAVKWSKNFVGGIVTIPEESAVNYDDFINITGYINKNNTKLDGELSKEEFRKQISIPADYYLKRGYKPETLDRFDIGLCLDKTNRFFTRIIVPIYNEQGKKVIASVARTTQPLCTICNKFHFANRPCPQNDIERIWSEKWLNSTGFKKASYLYNFWNAKDYIRSSSQVILVEGQGDVWRLEEAGIHSSDSSSSSLMVLVCSVVTYLMNK